MLGVVRPAAQPLRGSGRGRPAAVLTAGGLLVRGFRGFLGVELPPESVEFFGTKAQVSVEGTVNGHPFDGLAFPTSDGAHFLNLNTKSRRRLGISEGDRLEFKIRRRGPAEVNVMPNELAQALSGDSEAQIWWAHLQPGHRRTALRFIAEAKSPEVRAWRVSDVLRRAKRYCQKEGPFYPTKEDQPSLSRRGGAH
ncbi:MAG TPA: YdeI/OmpD-associated family protein [Candidatus Dormibacteraeota bacterium]|nr:YdeI/OmpD-associated family protein [Candidatus Dormibacteraeota bacterium]